MAENNRYKEIAEAFILVAKANHYMVSFSYRATIEELEMALAILQTKDISDTSIVKAIDLLKQEMKGCDL